MWWRLAALLGLMATIPTAVMAECRLALAFGLDVSGSVDAEEYALQQNGLAGALLDPAVAQTLMALADRPVNILIYEWSASGYQKVIADWTAIRNRMALEQLAARVAGNRRAAAPYPTSIGDAMNFAALAFSRVPECDRFTLDLSGDGKSNSWPPPERVRRQPVFRNITVNALVIGDATPMGNNQDRTLLADLVAYFEAQVIHGPNAFVEAAEEFQDYQRAMTRKLLRELEGPNLTLGPITPSPPDHRTSVDVADLIAPVPFNTAK